jgi:hypothetical protein
VSKPIHSIPELCVPCNILLHEKVMTGSSPVPHKPGYQGKASMEPHCRDTDIVLHRDSWRLNAGAEDAVGVGAYFGRLDWQTDSVARVKSLVSGGPAEQTGMIDIGDAVSSPCGSNCVFTC